MEKFESAAHIVLSINFIIVMAIDSYRLPKEADFDFQIDALPSTIAGYSGKSFAQRECKTGAIAQGQTSRFGPSNKSASVIGELTIKVDDAEVEDSQGFLRPLE
jgi:hypothetical protein